MSTNNNSASTSTTPDAYYTTVNTSISRQTIQLIKLIPATVLYYLWDGDMVSYSKIATTKNRYVTTTVSLIYEGCGQADTHQRDIIHRKCI